MTEKQFVKETTKERLNNNLYKFIHISDYIIGLSTVDSCWRNIFNMTFLCFAHIVQYQVDKHDGCCHHQNCALEPVPTRLGDEPACDRIPLLKCPWWWASDVSMSTPLRIQVSLNFLDICWYVGCFRKLSNNNCRNTVIDTYWSRQEHFLIRSLALQSTETI